MEELTELFVAENKLNAAMTDIKSLPAVSITKVTSAHGLIKYWPLCGLCAPLAEMSEDTY